MRRIEVLCEVDSVERAGPAWIRVHVRGTEWSNDVGDFEGVSFTAALALAPQFQVGSKLKIAIADAENGERDAALEEAARAAGGWTGPVNTGANAHVVSETCRGIAARIRELKSR